MHITSLELNLTSKIKGDFSHIKCDEKVSFQVDIRRKHVHVIVYTDLDDKYSHIDAVHKVLNYLIDADIIKSIGDVSSYGDSMSNDDPLETFFVFSLEDGKIYYQKPFYPYANSRTPVHGFDISQGTFF